MPAARPNGRSSSTPSRRIPARASGMLIMPGNHDLNVVDRANPARLDLPTSRNKRLRKLRALSAIAAVQGARVRVVDQERGRLGETLAAALAPHLGTLTEFADAGKPRLLAELPELWSRALSDGAGAGPRRRARGHPAELQRRDAFLLHQCARHDLDRTGPRHRLVAPAVSRGALDRSRCTITWSSIRSRPRRCPNGSALR